MLPSTIPFKGTLVIAAVVLVIGKILYEINGITLQIQQNFDPNEDPPIRNSEPQHPPSPADSKWDLFPPFIHFFHRADRRLTSPEQSGFWRPVSFSGQPEWIKRLFNLRQTSPFGAGSESSSATPRLPRPDEPKTNWISYHSVTINDIDVAYYNPFPSKKVSGIALLIHACGQQARDWFQLPEHRRVAAQLVRKQLALLAISSGNRVNGCWSTRFPHWQNEDVERVTIVVRQWSTNHNILPSAPIYAVGISSGGTMLSVLSSSDLVPNLASQALYISPGNYRAFRNASKAYPNTLFVHHISDQHYASSAAVTAARKILLKQKVQLVGELPLSPITLTPLTLHEREPRFSVDVSRKIYSMLKAHRGNIEEAMRTSTNEHLVQLWADRSARRAIKQIVRVAGGHHELSSMHSEKVADWLLSNGRRS